ncbi:P-loop NTPase fold protein [Roseibium porphyridii]|uniref:P-loop NTPase fold protein n=1 Tax=Roseibium porphyridii TaxID=2866279 RepID=A0ABY8F4Z6_9HYPH|nr:P-loop NTPase fold protein [Roseibium sp. KMA01]WFE89839.1 P-loop NTPase fold protein [Roseibium sp. KMA01]
MASTQHNSVAGDRPLGAGGEDKLGFRDVARRIAQSLVDHASDKGLVIGIEGAWGSGKSSLLFLIEDELAKLPQAQRPSVINFRPWLVGNRDALLANLFESLAKEINLVALRAGDASGISKEKAKAAGEALRKFVSALGSAGSAVELAGDAIAFAPLKWIGKGLRVAGSWAKGKSADPPLDVLKDRLVKSLRDLGHRFIITIDDVDRLEPAEVIEVLRLARSVADLPNVIYLLCYDSDILAHSVEQASRVQDGRAYLEKIVQLAVMVPQPEPFRLRQWFGDELRQFSSTRSDDELSRLRSVVDFEGGRQLKTPRSVVRSLDSLRFYWPPIRDGGGDLADLVWLKLIKDGNPALYRWIEDYCATAALLNLGTVRVDDAERAQQLNALHAAVAPEHFADHHYRYFFAEPLPAASVDFAEKGNGFTLFQRVSDVERNAAITGGRLASPDHYRLYFALSGPSHALKHHDHDAFWAAADNSPDRVAAVLLHLHALELTGSLSKADLLLERLKGVGDETLTPNRCRNILAGFANVMDDAYRARPFDHGWIVSLWDRATALVARMVARLDADTRAGLIQHIFGEGRALGWLTTLMRKETFAHGRYGNREKPDSEWFFTNEELDEIFELMLGRIRRLTTDELHTAVCPLDILFAWKQAGDEAGPREMLRSSIETDSGLIDVLEKLTTIRTSSDRGSYSVLTRNNLEAFLDFDEARQRIEALRMGNNALGARATALACAFNEDDGF